MKTVLPTFRPKMIVWHLTASSGQQHDEARVNGERKALTTQECLLVIDGIVRLARPIIVFTGPSLLQRPDLFSITEYAVALGLKVIHEVRPQDLNDDIVRKFSVFGARIFRIMVDDCIAEDIDHRYQQTENFRALEQAVSLARKAGLEVHLGATIRRPNLRQVEYNHDYAIRQSAVGLYCHFHFDESTGSIAPSDIETLIEAIAQMKNYSPRDMYFSPQCIRYSHKGNHVFPVDDEERVAVEGEPARSPDEPKSLFSNTPAEWLHWCMGGKTFAYIEADGTVQLCAGVPIRCGDLREVGYDFAKIWERSPVMQSVRDNDWSCTETRQQFPVANTSSESQEEGAEDLHSPRQNGVHHETP